MVLKRALGWSMAWLDVVSCQKESTPLVLHLILAHCAVFGTWIDVAGQESICHEMTR